MSDYLENKFIDALLRGQAFPSIPTLFVALFTANPTDAGGGTECTGGSYARVSYAASLANFSGTQAAASTTVSTGTSGQSTNNAAITFPVLTAAWGTITGVALFDAATAGNMLVWATVPAKTPSSGDTVAFAAGQMSWTAA